MKCHLASMSSPTTSRGRTRRASRATVPASIEDHDPSNDSGMMDEDDTPPPKATGRTPAKRRGRKSQKIVDSDEAEVENDYEQGEDASATQAAAPAENRLEEPFQVQQADGDAISLGLFEEDTIGSTTPQVPPTNASASKKNGAIMRRTKKKTTPVTPARGQMEMTTDSNNMDATEESQPATDAVQADESWATIGEASASTPHTTSKTPISTPRPSSSVPEVPTKRKEIEGGSGAAERPAKRAKLPAIKKHAATPGSGTPSGSAGDKGIGKSGRERQIVDGPVTNDIDLRSEDAFAQLFRKVR